MACGRASRPASTRSPAEQGSSSTALARRSEAIRRGGTALRNEHGRPSRSRKTRSSAKRMPKVWTLRQRGISSPAPASSRSRPASPSSRARPRRGDRQLAAEHVRGGQAAKAAMHAPPRAQPPNLSPSSLSPMPGKVAVFGPNPMLSVTIEAMTADGGDDIHVHAAGQGVWVARTAAELGAEATLCGLIGGECGAVAAAAAGAAAVRPAADRDRRRQRRLHPRPPQRRARARRPERQHAALAARGRQPLLRRLRGGARRRRAGALRPLPERGAAAGDLRRPGRRREGERHAGRRRPLAAAARQRPGGRSRPGQDQRLGAGRVRRWAGRHARPHAGGGREAARGGRRRRRSSPAPRSRRSCCAATRPGS